MNDRAFIECKDKETTMAVAKSIETDDQMFERLPGTAKIATATASISTSSIAAATVATIARRHRGKKVRYGCKTSTIKANKSFTHPPPE